jgi:hypothetical protein
MSEPCANHSAKNRECDRQATPGHIYCTPCRVATGGYNRYTSPAVPNRTQNSSKQQE